MKLNDPTCIMGIHPEKFFDKIESGELIANLTEYFVSSEKYEDYNPRKNPRKIRKMILKIDLIRREE